ncbi:MAG: 50S ribosomal protein L13 [Candidatus Wildermuthbacteria bacterium]|nr:50S ribosomal protein L13 [Candidatus Wildermuthbacteria bacterium]
MNPFRDRKRETHTIDVAGKSLGRVAVEIAVLLRGKRNQEFLPHVDAGDFVKVEHADQIKLTGKKLQQKKYRRHSRYPGGFREQTAKELLAKAPEEILRKAVRGMLPPNRLRDRQMKRLQFEK